MKTEHGNGLNGLDRQAEQNHREEWHEIHHLCQEIYRDVKRSYVDKGRYHLPEKAWEKIKGIEANPAEKVKGLIGIETYLQKVSEQTTSEQTQILVLDFLNKELGALPDDLGDLYVKIAFSPAELRRHLPEDKDIHRAFKRIAEEIRQKGISLDTSKVSAQMKHTEQELEPELTGEESN